MAWSYLSQGWVTEQYRGTVFRVGWVLPVPGSSHWTVQRYSFQGWLGPTCSRIKSLNSTEVQFSGLAGSYLFQDQVTEQYRGTVFRVGLVLPVPGSSHWTVRKKLDWNVQHTQSLSSVALPSRHTVPRTVNGLNGQLTQETHTHTSLSSLFRSVGLQKPMRHSKGCCLQKVL